MRENLANVCALALEAEGTTYSEDRATALSLVANNTTLDILSAHCALILLGPGRLVFTILNVVGGSVAGRGIEVLVKGSQRYFDHAKLALAIVGAVIGFFRLSSDHCSSNIHSAKYHHPTKFLYLIIGWSK